MSKETKNHFLTFSLTQLQRQPGEDHSYFLNNGFQIECGSSLQLTNKATQLINHTFNSSPNKAWQNCQLMGRSLFYGIISAEGDKSPRCAIRAFLDNMLPEDGIGRLCIEYIRTQKKYRGCGLATLLVQFLLNTAISEKLDVCVMSTEEAAPFWMKFGFILEQDNTLNNRYNDFEDTHLLKLPNNVSGSVNTTYIQSQYLESDSSELSEYTDNTNEDDDIQLAIGLSLSESNAR